MNAEITIGSATNNGADKMKTMKLEINVQIVQDQPVPEGARYIGSGDFGFLCVGDVLEASYDGKLYPRHEQWSVYNKLADGRIQVRSNTGLLMTWEKITPAYYKDYVVVGGAA